MSYVYVEKQKKKADNVKERISTICKIYSILPEHVLYNPLPDNIAIWDIIDNPGHPKVLAVYDVDLLDVVFRVITVYVT